MESPKQESAELERMFDDYIKGHPEYADKHFSSEEIRTVASLVRIQESEPTEDFFKQHEDRIRQYLDARLSVRGAGDKMPVIDGSDTVIGFAAGPEDAKRVVWENNK